MRAAALEELAVVVALLALLVIGMGFGSAAAPALAVLGAAGAEGPSIGRLGVPPLAPLGTGTIGCAEPCDEGGAASGTCGVCHEL